LPAPSTLPPNNRIAPQELQVFRLVDVTLKNIKNEPDGDIHLVLSDGTNGMDAEIPSPSCVGAASPFAQAIARARAKFQAGQPAANATISVEGVGFFDFLHGQVGAAPNGIELHPVLDVCFGHGCILGATDGAPDAAPPPDAGDPDGDDDAGSDSSAAAVGITHAIETAFVILLENHNWSDIRGNASAPYINGTLLPIASYAEAYKNPPGIHPSAPNYIWLESGSNLGITTDDPPAQNHQSTTSHLSTLLDAAGVSWKSYAEGIGGTTCPLVAKGDYAPKHVPFVYFDDVTDTNSSTSTRCIQHVRPYAELASDLTNGAVARYNFITPNLCDDMHNTVGCASADSVKNGDTWLSQELPKILASTAYASGGAVFITWDESEGGDLPIGMIVVSPFAKGNGYSNTIPYTHSSTLRTMQELFGVTPFLRDAANATDLSDLFATFP
jgi:hypothetical protein